MSVCTKRTSPLSKPAFPSRRFRGIGASAEEVAEMQRAFNASDLVVQKGQSDYLKGLSVGHLREYLAAWRADSADDVFELDDLDEGAEGLTGGLSEPSDDLTKEGDSEPFDE
jgi:hypothetical protein